MFQGLKCYPLSIWGGTQDRFQGIKLPSYKILSKSPLSCHRNLGFLGAGCEHTARHHFSSQPSQDTGFNELPFCSNWYFGFRWGGWREVSERLLHCPWFSGEVHDTSHKCKLPPPEHWFLPMSSWGLDDRYLAGSGPNGAQWTPCGFLAVAISGLCTELSLLLTIQSKGERGRRREENSCP